MTVTDPPARSSGVVSQLRPPTSCPIYAPGDYDTDTPEAPFDSPVLFGCAVDSTGATYGTVTGDGGTGDLAVVPGGREVGEYYEFDASVRDYMLAATAMDSSGSNALFHAWASTTSNTSSWYDCCAEDHPEDEIPVKVVAVGTTGLLLSYGTYDATTLVQLRTEWDPAVLFPGYVDGDYAGVDDRFYVNAPPYWIPCGADDDNGNCIDPGQPTQGEGP